MKKQIFLIGFFLISSLSFGQYVQDAPWISLLKDTSTSKEENSIQDYTLEELNEAFEAYWARKENDPEKKGSGFKPYMRWSNYWQYHLNEDGKIKSPSQLWSSYINKVNSNNVPNETSDWQNFGPVNVSRLNGATPGIGRINQMAVDPTNDQIWYAGAPSGGIWKTTDGGLNWTPLFDEFPQIGVSGIAIDSNNTDIVYIATGDDDALDSYSAGVFKSTDGGNSWTNTGLLIEDMGKGESLNEIVIDPTDSNIIWVAGNGKGLQKSTDGGATFTRVKSGNIKDFALKPGDPNTIYAVDSDDFFKSTDGGATFTNLDGDPDETVEVLPTSSSRIVIGVTPANPEVVYLLYADTPQNNYAYLGVFKSSDSGETFTKTTNTVDVLESSQAWFDLALTVDPNDEDIIYTGCLNVWKSSNGGDIFEKLNSWSDYTPSFTHADIHTLKFFGDRLYVGSDGGLYASDNGGASFTDYSDGLRVTQFYRMDIGKSAGKAVGGTQDNSGFIYGNDQWYIYTGGDGMDYEIDPSNNEVAYGFTQFGGVLWTTTSFGPLSGVTYRPSNASGNWIVPLTVNKEGEVFAGYEAVWKLVAGEWSRLSDNLTGDPMDDLEVSLNDSNIMYAAVDNRMYISTDAGGDFDFLTSFDNPISDMAINSNDPNTVYVTLSRRVGSNPNSQPSNPQVIVVTVDANQDATQTDITFDLPTDQAFLTITHQPRDINNSLFIGTSLGVYRTDDTIDYWEDFNTNLPNTSVSDLDISLEDEVIVASTYGRGFFVSPIDVTLPNEEVGISSISPSNNVISCSVSDINFTALNEGLNAVTKLLVSYSFNQEAPIQEEFDVNLEPGQEVTLSLNNVPTTLSGLVNLNVEVTSEGDTFSDNNQLNASFIVNEFANGSEVFDFEGADGDFVTYNEGGNGSVWERGEPTGTLLNQTTSGTNVYGTILAGDHPNETKGYLISPCYELANITAPVLKFNMAFELEQNWDIVYVEYSTNGGVNWNVLGTIDSEPNWYNSDRTENTAGNDCYNCPGAQWTGTASDMTEYAYDFVANAARGETDLTNEPNVIFRVVFHSDQSVVEEGAIIDDFQVFGVQDDEDDDNDGILDVDDNCQYTPNPDQTDTDGDGEGDACDLDDDNDGILDVDDNCPLVFNPGQEDFDGDGIGDACDEDIDNDGVLNENDLCPTTESGAIVDVDGCQVFSLPANAFTVKTVAETCSENNNGQISIETTLSQEIKVTLLNDIEEVITSEVFTSSYTFENVNAGAYEVRLSINEIPDYSRSYGVMVGEPEPLSVQTVMNNSDEVTLQLQGATTYTIKVNEETFVTSESEITLSLNQIENQIEISSDLDCQGSIMKKIVLSDKLFVYPNPVRDGIVNIYLGSTEKNSAVVSIYQLNGKAVYRKAQDADNGYISSNIAGLAPGLYILNVEAEDTVQQYKIIKK